MNAFSRATASSLPRYVELPGNLVGRLPYRATQATMHALLLKSHGGVLQRVCDRFLNEPSGGAMLFQASSDLVMLIALYAKHMASGDPLDKSKGYVREIDIGFWIEVIGGPTDDPTLWRPYFLPVFMCVSGPSAMAAGREIFGYPKTIGAIKRRSDVAWDDPRVVVATEQFTRFAPDEEAVVARLFSIERHEARFDAAPIPITSHAMKHSITALYRERRRAGLDLPATRDVSPAESLPMIFLKQFRDVATPNRACLQQIVAVTANGIGPAQVSQFNGSVSVSIARSASHPIRTDLGLLARQEVETGFAINFDFEVGFGDVLWSAPAAAER